MTQDKPVGQRPNRQRTVLIAADLKNSILAELYAGNSNQIAYTPYGKLSAQHGVMTRLGFNGELCESIPEWYLLGNGYRAYNPRLMRFQSPDSLSPFGKGGLNAYMYCGGEPVMNSDPTGQSIWAISRGLMLLTDRVGAVATQMLSKAIKQVAGAAQSAKKAFADNLLFDPAVITKLGPSPPKVVTKPRAGFVRPLGRYQNPYSSPFISTQPTGGRSTRPASFVKNTSSSKVTSVNRPEDFRHSSADTHTELLDMNGVPVAIIRTGR